MLSGPIQPVQAEDVVDRATTTLALWESGPDVTPDLPWHDAAGLDQQAVAPLFSGAADVCMVVGATAASRKLLELALDLAQPPTRLYVYADRAIEGDATVVKRIAAHPNTTLTRLGHRPPADWIVASKGQSGLLLVGPSASDRRWLIPVDGPLARTLYESFRHLFWFHAAREALPDSGGAVAFRSPLPAPDAHRSDDLTLPSGRLVVGKRLDDPVPDAEVRVAPRLGDPGRARVIFTPPANQLPVGAGSPVSLEVPKSLAGRGHTVVWTDLGLPAVTVTRQRFVMNLAESPIALQLEWPRGAAVDLFHRLERAAGGPTWAFHPARQLGAIRGRVLLDNTTTEQQVRASVAIDVGRVEAQLTSFTEARPASFPAAPALAKQVVYRWTRVPASLPPGARPAQLVRAWTAVDEWASRALDGCRTALDTLDEQEGLLGRLRRWLPSRDAAVLERRKLRDLVDELGEARPSQSPDDAGERLRRIAEVAVRLNALLHGAHDSRQTAEDARAEHDQRAQWQERLRTAEEGLRVAQEKLAANEAAQGRASADVEAAEGVLSEAIEALRSERATQLEADRERLAADLEAALQTQQDLEQKHSGRPPKSERKAVGRQVRQAEQALADNERAAAAVASWTPPQGTTPDEERLLVEARRALAGLRDEAKALAKDVSRAQAEASAEFRFVRPARLPGPTHLDLPAAPPAPAEAPPELGDLFEHDRRRYLAIKTWEQLRRAEPVATRLRAELVVASSTSK